MVIRGPQHSELIPWKSRSELATEFFGPEGNERHRDIEGIREIGVLYFLLIDHLAAGLVLVPALLELSVRIL
jgi:hypothetical protein